MQASLQTCLLHAFSNIHGGDWLGLVHQPEVGEAGISLVRLD